MSVTTTRDRQEQRTLSCGTCGEDVESDKAVKGSFCSLECFHAHKGTKALRNVHTDHRFCSSCYRPRKTIYRPADDESPKLRTKALVVREAFVGFEDATQHAAMGPYGLECECGSVGANTAEEILRDGEAFEIYLKWLFDEMRAEGQLDAEFCVRTFADAFWDHSDFERAVGEALYE